MDKTTRKSVTPFVTVTQKREARFPAHAETIINWERNTPHWKTPGNEGHASLRISTNMNRMWLTLDASEVHTEDGKFKSAHRTMLSLLEPEARALYEALHWMFGNEVVR